MADTVEYYISDPVFVNNYKKGGTVNRVYFWEYTITNNVELPNHTYKADAIGNSYNPNDPSSFESDPSIKNIAIENNWVFFSATKVGNRWLRNTGNEPQVLKDAIFKFQKEKILLEFENNPPYIEAKSYKNQKYPKLGTPLSLYNQDPIEYTFNSIIIDKTTQEPLSGVKIKDLDGIKTTSNNDGSFEIKGTFSPGKVQKLIFNQKKYSSLILVITTLNGSIRSDINIVDLVPDSADVEGSIARAQGSSKEEREKMTKEEKKDFIKNIAQNVINELKERALPFVIKKLLCEPYGVCDPIGLIDKAKELKNKAKDLNEKRKENKAQKQAEKEIENEIADNQTNY